MQICNQNKSLMSNFMFRTKMHVYLRLSFKKMYIPTPCVSRGLSGFQFFPFTWRKQEAGVSQERGVCWFVFFSLLIFLTRATSLFFSWSFVFEHHKCCFVRILHSISYSLFYTRPSLISSPLLGSGYRAFSLLFCTKLAALWQKAVGIFLILVVFITLCLKNVLSLCCSLYFQT